MLATAGGKKGGKAPETRPTRCLRAGLAKGVSKCYGNQGEKLRNGFYSAFSICANIGARMCRASELVASVGSDTGCGPSSPLRVLACAARTLNATGPSRVTLSLR